MCSKQHSSGGTFSVWDLDINRPRYIICTVKEQRTKHAERLRQILVDALLGLSAALILLTLPLDLLGTLVRFRSPH